MFLVQDELKELLEQVKQTRRALHRIPEVGNKEYKTQAFIKGFLSELSQVEVIDVCDTGVLAYINAEAEETVALRADIDGLPMLEMTTHDFVSDHKGFMHACGHDGHMTLMLYMTKYFSEHRDQLKKNMLIIFQPAEEGPGGAERILNEGWFTRYNVTEVFGYHLYPEVVEGFFGTKPGPLMAMTGEFDITIQTISGHGAMPHKALDAIVIASEMIGQLQQIVSRRLSPIEPAVVTVGKLTAGERRNIIAGSAILEGTCRAFSESVFKDIEKYIAITVKGFETMYECKIDLDFRTMYPPVVNHPDLVKDFVEANGGNAIVQMIDPQMISEDFSYYQKAVPGIFVFIGTYNEENDKIYALHHSKFDFNETALLNGMQATLNYLGKRGALQL